MTSDLINIEAGPDKVQFSVSGPLIKSASSYFRGALEENFSEGRDGVVRLPDISAEVIGYFLGWLYCQPPFNKIESWKIKGDILAHLYVFGDRFGVPTLKTDVIHQLRRDFTGWLLSDFNWSQGGVSRARNGLPDQTITLLWQNLPEQDPARKLVRDSIVHFLDDFKYTLSTELNKLSALPPDLLAQLVIWLSNPANRNIGRLNQGMNACEYLGHEPCKYSL